MAVQHGLLLFPNTFTKWTGLGLDFVIYMLTLLCLYKLLMALFSSRDIASAGVIFYGLCLLGMSTMLMIRMYVLLTLLSVLLAYLFLRVIREFKPCSVPSSP
ncbi:MAG: glycosyltransferase family 39 protein [Oscillospiraceae bacterium]